MKLRKSWKTRLDEALKRGHFTEDDKRKISVFNTCFVGEHYYGPFIEEWWLTDEELELGRRAYFAVLRDDVASALGIYEEVQKLYT